MTERIIQELTKALIEEFLEDLDNSTDTDDIARLEEKWEKRLTKK